MAHGLYLSCFFLKKFVDLILTIGGTRTETTVNLAVQFVDVFLQIEEQFVMICEVHRVPELQ